MNRGVIVAFTLALAGATPALAANTDCLYLGVSSSQGALICQAGVLAQCKAARWLPTKKFCKVETALASTKQSQVPSAVPVPATAMPPQAPPLPQPVPQTAAVAPLPMVPAQPVLLHVLTASYAVGDSGLDVVFDVRAICDGKPDCSFVGDARFLHGDPAPRLKGRFSINYACTTGFQTRDSEHVVFSKNETVTLSCR